MASQTPLNTLEKSPGFRSLNQTFLVGLVNGRFLTGQEPRPDPNAVSPQHQHGCPAPTVYDAAGLNHRNWLTLETASAIAELVAWPMDA